MNLPDDLVKEIDRSNKILNHKQGTLGAIFIEKDIEYARNAIVNQDNEAMTHGLKTLKEYR